jgi:hypothetical protein
MVAYNCFQVLLCQLSSGLSKSASNRGMNQFTIHRNNERITFMFRIAALFFIGVSFMAVANAQQRPLITDDIDIVPAGSLEISAGVDFLQNAKFPLSGLRGDLTRLGDIRIRQGFASNVEIQIEGTLQNYLAINSNIGPSAIPLNVAGNSTNDFDDITVSAKIRLLSETKNLPAVGMKFGYQLPNSDQAKGIGTNQINIFSKLIVQKKFGKRAGRSPLANVYGNIGLGIMNAPLANFTQNDMLLYGLAGIFRVNDRINIATEINGRASVRRDTPLGTESLSQLRIGTQVKASGLRFDTAAVFGLTRFSPKTGVTFGITYQSPVFLPVAK